jgi:L-ascorbate metabolism protein UlaG (beta-lactamase superfamily)
VTYVGHATVLIEMDGQRLLTDPLLRMNVGPLHRHGPRVAPEWIENIDAVLLSHLHRDHLDMPSLRRLGKATRLIVPRGAWPLLRRAGFTELEELAQGESTSVGTLKVVATDARHAGFRAPFGPPGDCLGFVVKGSNTAYFAGDTEVFEEMSDIGPNLDLALLPVWGWGPTLGDGHMDPAGAAEALTYLQPRVAVPIHWGTLSPVGARWLGPKYLTEPPQEFRRQAAELAADVEIRILEPGESTTLDQ